MQRDDCLNVDTMSKSFADSKQTSIMHDSLIKEMDFCPYSRVLQPGDYYSSFVFIKI
jgi:hypothetical protein